MRIVCISDTHGAHHGLHLPPGDMLLHAGDVSSRGTEEQVADFLDWFGKLPYPHKVLVAGNHDFYFEQAPREDIRALIPEGVTYLNDSGVELGGLRIWGSPIQPWFFDWAFNRQRGADIQQHWDLIPPEVDILITHGPAYGILDQTVGGEAVGCEDLLNTIRRVRPQVHLAGHIHEAYGVAEHEGTLYINASILNVRYRIANDPVILEVDTMGKIQLA